jgi:serine/threonine protein kinase
MTPSEWSRLKEVLAAALSIPDSDRDRFLSQACRGDEGLRRKAESLLAESESAANFLEAPALGEAIAILEETEGRNHTPALSVGDRLGRYEILAPLGAGGMGEVYRARDSKLKREVAVKVLPADVAGDQERLARFEREASAASALSDAHIVAIFDVGREGAIHYIVSELVEGETLRTYIAGGPLPLPTALDFAEQLASGLAAAHEGGVLHRDLKPENVLVSKSGVAKIADFGLAKHIERTDLGPEDLSGAKTAELGTAAGVILGTVGYMSPEQVHGHVADTRSDIFAFGCVLYEMLTGDRAFAGVSPIEKMAAILRDEPPPPSRANRDVPEELDRVVVRCLEKIPDRRFQSARDLAFAIRTFRIAPPAAKPARKHPKRASRRWRSSRSPATCRNSST